MTIADRMSSIQSLIRAYEKKYRREENSVHLLGVGKGQPIEKLVEAWHAGLRLFGENYLQEALKKIEHFKSKGFQAEWHFIGTLQRNKTRKIAEHFDWIHTVDDVVIARRLHDQRPDHLPSLNICIEVNINREEAKSGVNLDKAAALVEYCMTLPRLRVRGLMCIPEHVDDFLTQQINYHRLYSLFQELHLTYPSLNTLSMGMSQDFEAAISEGATIVRIGTALFGERLMK